MPIESRNTTECFEVVHPLDDVLEEKHHPEGLGRIHMSRTVKVSLMTLRVYLVAMSLMLLYRLLDSSGVFTNK